MMIKLIIKLNSRNFLSKNRDKKFQTLLTKDRNFKTTKLFLSWKTENLCRKNKCLYILVQSVCEFLSIYKFNFAFCLTIKSILLKRYATSYNRYYDRIPILNRRKGAVKTSFSNFLYDISTCHPLLHQY